MMKEKRWPILIGLLFILSLAAVLYKSPLPLIHLLNHVENLSYDLRVRKNYRPLPKGLPIAIIDIDDGSLKKEGRWPWQRNRLAALTSELYRLGANVIAFDILFPEREANPAQEVIQGLKEKGAHGSAVMELEAVQSSFDYDQLFGEALGQGKGMLGFVFRNGGAGVGDLPLPSLRLAGANRELSIAQFDSYLANISPLQQQAKGGGFINSNHDLDGIIRSAPLLLRYQDALYSSLGLEAVRLFLGAAPVELVTEHYGDQLVLEAIQLGERLIPTDPWGRLLIPFRGPPYSIPYISAANVLEGKRETGSLNGYLVFVGSSATAMGDLYATSMAPVFPGIEIHAQIAASLLDGYLPYKPTWGKGASLALLLIIGLSCALIFPYLGPIRVLFVTMGLIGALLGLEHWLWVREKMAFSATFSVFAILLLFSFNELFGYQSEKGRRLKLKTIFSQYIPAERVDAMAKEGDPFSMEGETKKLTVLFADIRNFTSFAESRSATDLKHFLNRFFTDMTRVIFEHKGTIDKYIGDLVMAFWGAPIDDPNHELNGVKASLAMQKKLKEQEGSPEVGIGINTGLMDVGDMGSEFRRAYTVLGDAVNIGSRLESATKFYHVPILVGEETWEKTKEFVCYKKIDRVRLQGKKQTIGIYEPICLKGEETAALKEEIALHEEALEEYWKQNWEGAEKAFLKLQQSSSNGKLYSLYLSRIEEYRAHPPGADWDGSYTSLTK